MLTETAYVLAYSTVLLNTDLYNPQVKRRMTKQEFTKNNRGINDGEDLPPDLLSSIYDEIASNEIRMKDEMDTSLPTAVPAGFAGALANVGRDLQREAYMTQSHGMANKTEVNHPTYRFYMF
jgi:brefeldin A-inhibited guanine nucleotide-exchange protein